MTVTEYFASLDEPQKTEMKKMHKFIRKEAPSLKPEIITSGMSTFISYGSFNYRTKSGCEGRWGILGISARKHGVSLYACGVKGEKYLAEIYQEKLGKADCGKGCIRFKTLEDLNQKELKNLIKEAVKLGPTMAC